MNAYQTRGYSLVAMVSVLLFLGMLLLTGLNQRLLTQIQIYQSERHYLIAQNLAQSSLHWGVSLRWPKPDQRWQCQYQQYSDHQTQLHACIKRSQWPDLALLQGVGKPATSKPAILLYQWVRLPAGWQQATQSLTVQPYAGGWLDLCPEKQDQYCQ